MRQFGTAETLVAVMNTWGVDHLFFNPGIDNAPILETIARLRAEGNSAPQAVLCLDEFVAMTAAHGHYMASGRPQAVSVHSELGVLQIGGALHNVQWGRVPVVFFTEHLSPSQRQTWRGEQYDQGNMVRNFVKWDYHLTENDNVAEVFSKAFQIAAAEPCGPVYLNLDRASLWGGKSSSFIVESHSSPLLNHAPVNYEEIGALLADAENPLIVTGYAGRHVKNVSFLEQLATMIGAQVLSENYMVNIPSDHPLAVQLSPVHGGRPHPLTTADVILAIDYDMHYAAPPLSLRDDAIIIHIDIDINKKGVPLWNRPPVTSIRGETQFILPQLIATLKTHLSPGKAAVIKERIERYTAENAAIRSQWHSIALQDSSREPVSANWLSHCINEVITSHDIIVNQTISPSSTVAHQITRKIPGTLFSCAGGCIGWAPGAAFGVKLASPGQRVIALMGDGAFVYGCPEAALYASCTYKAPFLSVIYNNQGYGAIKGLFSNQYGKDSMGADIPHPPDYAGIARSCHCFGLKVTKPSEVKPALEQGLKAVSEGTSAVIDVWLDAV